MCSRVMYRRLLNFVPGYVEFLKALMSSTTILYIGFSFTDGEKKHLCRTHEAGYLIT